MFYDRFALLCAQAGVSVYKACTDVGLNRTAVAPLGGKRPVSDEEIKFALFGGDGEITDEMYAEVKHFAAFVKQREKEKREKS